MLDFWDLGEQRICRDNRFVKDSCTIKMHPIEYVQCVVLCSEVGSSVQCATDQRYQFIF